MNLTAGENRGRSALALALLVPVASIGAWCYFFAAPGEAWSMAAYWAAKAWLWVLPVVWLVWLERTRPRIPKLKREGMAAGVVTGVAICAVILGAYYGLAVDWIEDKQPVADTITQRLSSPLVFWGFGGFVILLNSLLEEYVWRWFVTTRCEALLRWRWPAVFLAAACFTAHHVLALDAYFELRIVVLGSLGVFIGGVTWSWLYARYRNIYAAYVSHIFADIAIFIIGHDLAFGW